MTIAVAVFPGTNCERDVVSVLRTMGAEAELVWHRETDVSGASGVVLPGGFAHGDYLRTGAIARFSPIMDGVIRLANEGRPVLGICNGFQILCEAQLLPGALVANAGRRFICRFVDLEVVDTGSVLTAACTVGQRFRIPLNSYEGNYVDPSHLGRTVIRYLENPNGSQEATAAVANDRGNVAGIMPHPERASDELLGSKDGQILLAGLVAASQGRRPSEMAVS